MDWTLKNVKKVITLEQCTGTVYYLILSHPEMMLRKTTGSEQQNKTKPHRLLYFQSVEVCQIIFSIPPLFCFSFVSNQLMRKTGLNSKKKKKKRGTKKTSGPYPKGNRYNDPPWAVNFLAHSWREREQAHAREHSSNLQKITKWNLLGLSGVSGCPLKVKSSTRYRNRFL